MTFTIPLPLICRFYSWGVCTSVRHTGLEKMETVTPFSIFNSIYFNGTIWKSFCSDRPPNEKVLRFSVYSNSGVVFTWINIVCLPRLKIFSFFFFWTLSVFFVDFRVTVRRTWSSPQNSSYIYKYFFLASFIHTFNQFVNQYFTGLRWSVVLFFF